MSYFRIIAALMILSPLAACGFRPLHGGGEASHQAIEEMSSIEIKPIANRSGQILRNYLQDALTPKGSPADPRYFLMVKLSESVERLAVKKDAFATRANLRMSASYSMTEIGAKNPALSSGAKAVSSYNILNSEFSTLINEKDARERALKEIGDRIKTSVSAFFARRNQKKE